MALTTTFTAGKPPRARWCTECGQKRSAHAANDTCPAVRAERIVPRVLAEHRLSEFSRFSGQCAYCRQSWPCDAVRLARLLANEES